MTHRQRSLSHGRLRRIELCFHKRLSHSVEDRWWPAHHPPAQMLHTREARVNCALGRYSSAAHRGYTGQLHTPGALVSFTSSARTHAAHSGGECQSNAVPCSHAFNGSLHTCNLMPLMVLETSHVQISAVSFPTEGMFPMRSCGRTSVRQGLEDHAGSHLWQVIGAQCAHTDISTQTRWPDSCHPHP